MSWEVDTCTDCHIVPEHSEWEGTPPGTARQGKCVLAPSGGAKECR
jgi:hypothetical protein